ncbi:Crp/Fnr family transcriptional regulator [Phyllobacterium myrsinacearum]|uniref:CRP-like cAMP-binding protein n=1 Tax=Phyllobacterium myrsinacearum TaxID=28101 RepID=A0A839EJP6_9HYPH|nr:Crp/Fnr family transcriptional regulator [Phyllobacterium myrsinacearum]MBA8879019.1 CRP-like cAMP-binding protein [Phyllobacterium myrsinacearum]
MNAAIYEERTKELRELDFFKKLDAESLDYIVRNVRVKTYARGQVIYQQGDACTAFHALLSGGVSVYFCSAEGREVIVSELQVGDVLGDVELVSKCARQANAIADQTTRLLTIEKVIFERLIHTPIFATALMTGMSKRLHQVIEFAEGMSIYSLETRLARLLMNMSETYGKTVSDGILIDRTISQSQIGHLINASRPKINAQLQAWKYENLIRVKNNQITILNRRSLENLSRQHVYSS